MCENFSFECGKIGKFFKFKFKFIDFMGRGVVIIITIFQKGLKGDINAQKSFLKSHHIALWNIFTVCVKETNNSADKSIIESKSVKSDLSEILKKAKIERIFTTIGKENSPRFKKWGIKEWINQCKSYFPHCKSVDEMLSTFFKLTSKP